MRSPWLDIPLADYEGHMALPTIAQAEVLAAEFGRLLAEYAPPTVAIIGCAGGNGFDHISAKTTNRVVGIDLNPAYIAAASSRYASTIPNLELYVADIQQPGLSLEPVDLIYAALVLEYVELEPTFLTLKSICRPNGILCVVSQLPSPSISAVTPSPFISLRALGPAMELVPPATLAAQAAQAGFVLLSSHQLALPSRKEFLVQVFRLSTAHLSLPANSGKVRPGLPEPFTSRFQRSMTTLRLSRTRLPLLGLSRVCRMDLDNSALRTSMTNSWLSSSRPHNSFKPRRLRGAA